MTCFDHFLETYLFLFQTDLHKFEMETITLRKDSIVGHHSLEGFVSIFDPMIDLSIN